MFKLENFGRKEEFYNCIIMNWAKDRNFDFHMDIASDYGFMVFDDFTALVAVYLYPVIGAEFALIGFPLASPSINKELRAEAIDYLVARVEELAKELNYKFIASYAGSKGAASMFERIGYEAADKDVIQFIKKL